jgi:hypothetical protein
LEGRFKLIDEKELPLELRLVDINEQREVHFDPQQLFSDHRPLWGRVTLEEQ